MRRKEDILKLIDEEDVSFIRLQFTDAFGNLKNIAVTPGQMERVLNNMYSFEGAAVFDGLYEHPDDLFLVPDLDTFMILPWRPQQGKVAKLICDVAEADGELCDYSPRTILKKVVAKAKAQGYRFMVNPECEFFLFHTDENGQPTTITHEKAGYFDVGPSDFGENARRDIVLNLEEMGFEIESSHHEKAPAQHEIDFSQGESIKIADAITTFRFAVRSVAKRFGLYATFMPKPKTEIAGSGMHMNFSMYRDGMNLFEGKDGQPSDDAKYFMGGVLKHAGALCAITNPIVNSYKRLVSGYDAPKLADWALNGESSAVKYHKSFGEAKVELRFPDNAANPYLAVAAIIAAGLDGIVEKALPDATAAAKPLPGNLKDAVELLKVDSVVCEALGEKFAEIYSSVKLNEWNDYMLQVTDWEIERYLTRL